MLCVTPPLPLASAITNMFCQWNSFDGLEFLSSFQIDSCFVISIYNLTAKYMTEPPTCVTILSQIPSKEAGFPSHMNTEVYARLTTSAGAVIPPPWSSPSSLPLRGRPYTLLLILYPLISATRPPTQSLFVCIDSVCTGSSVV